MTLSMAAYFVLSGIGARWSAGLEGKATIEFSAVDKDGIAIEQDIMQKNMSEAAEFLQNHPAIEAITVLDKEAVQEMLSEWLGDASTTDAIPLPGLIRVDFKSDVILNIPDIEARLNTISPYIRLDQHQDWLSHVLQFTGALQFFASLLIGIVTLITIVAISGAVKSRIAIHHEDVSLLHLIGATDMYIMHQFQNHMTKLTLKGALFGLLIGGMCLMFIGGIVANMQINLIPDFSFSIGHFFVLCLLPALLAGIAYITARITVLRSLAKMP